VTQKKEELPGTSTSSLSSAIAVVASSFVVSRLLSDKPPVFSNWLFIHLKSGYSTILFRIQQLFLKSRPEKLLKRYAFFLDIRSVQAVVQVAGEYLPVRKEL